MITDKVLLAARETMRRQTKLNNAPAWALTEIAVKKGGQLAEQFGVDKNQVLTSLYLAHTVFSDEIRGEVQQNHWRLSGDFASDFLQKKNVSGADAEAIVNAIRAHHNNEQCKTKMAEIVKNAECFKFVSVEGSLIYLHDLGRRGLTISDAAEAVISKLNQKLSYLTLPELRKEADENAKIITNYMNRILGKSS